MALALNNLKRIDMPLNKETNQPTIKLNVIMEPFSSRVSSLVSMRNLIFSKTLRKKNPRWNDTRMLLTLHFYVILETAPFKTVIVRPLISHFQTIPVRRTRYARHYWWSKDKLKSDFLLCIPTHEHASVSRPAKTYFHRVFTDTLFLITIMKVTKEFQKSDGSTTTILLSGRLSFYGKCPYFPGSSHHCNS